MLYNYANNKSTDNQHLSCSLHALPSLRVRKHRKSDTFDRVASQYNSTTTAEHKTPNGCDIGCEFVNRSETSITRHRRFCRKGQMGTLKQQHVDGRLLNQCYQQQIKGFARMLGKLEESGFPLPRIYIHMYFKVLSHITG